MIKRIQLILLVVSTCAPFLRADDGVFRQAIAPREWSFPRDHGRHDGFKLEWWYFTGNLRDSTGRRFGYQLTFFRSAFAAEKMDRPTPWRMTDLYFAHAAVSDIQSGTFVFKDRLARPHTDLASSSDQTLDVSLLDWSAKLDGKNIHLKCAENELAIDLECTDGCGPVLEGPGGVNVKGHEPGQASYYYSLTRLKTAGKLTVKGKAFEVEGLSWMDHEFSSDSMAKNQVSWDWMGLQLDDGSDLMIYRMRDDKGGADYLSGTRIKADGEPQYLPREQLKVSGDQPWKSSASGGVYPQRWKVSVDGQPLLTITSDMPGQELLTTASTKVNYFEGSATVRNEGGKTIGQGYLEMTGYVK